MTNIQIKQFAIFKAKEKKNPNSPDYNISIKSNDKFVTIGGCWLKDMKDGTKFFSCKLSDGYKELKGFSIVRDEEEVLAPEISDEQIPL